LPSQLAEGVNVLPVQLANLHPVTVDQGRQAPAPLQVPSFEQSPPRALVAIQSFLGSAPPEGTGEQVPTLPAVLQLMQRPPVLPSLHALLQQTPSVQKVLAHWVPSVHAAPAGLSPQELFTQVLGDTQSASVLQVFSHSAELQMKVPHGILVGVTQLPRPSQVDVGVSDELVAQLEALHLMPGSTFAHFPDLHSPVVPQVAGAVTPHRPWGSGAPSATAVHRPREPVRLQAMQAPAQGVWQQTPWAQLPDIQSFPLLHSCPSWLFPHEPLGQGLPGTHCVASTVHDL